MKVKKSSRETTKKPGTSLYSLQHTWTNVSVWVTIRTICLFLAMLGVLFLMAAVLPLSGLWFHTAFLTELGNWLLWPAHLLGSGWQLPSPLFGTQNAEPPPLALSWQATGLLFAVFALL